MKKTFSLFAILFFAATANAQFKVIPGGMTPMEGDKNYVVFEVEGSQEELYTKAKSALTMMYNSAKDVLSCNEKEVISINAMTSETEFGFKKMGVRYGFGARYIIKVQFKDGRIRVDSPNIELFLPISQRGKGGSYSLEAGGAGMTYHLFKKDGTPREEATINEIGDYFNALVNTLINKIKGTEQQQDEDW